jgi:hypothetical protein
MPTLETLTEADLQGLFTSKSRQRARSYVSRVRVPVRSGQTLTARVRGTDVYDVEIDVKPSGIAAFCTCPYDWGGYCKHIGAVLLKWLQDPDAFTKENVLQPSEERPLDVLPMDPPPTRRPEEKPSWLSTPFARRRRDDEAHLSAWLSELKIQELRQIAQRRHWDVGGTRKARVVEQILEYATDPREIRQAIDSLDREHQQVFDAMVLLGNGPNAQGDDLERVAEAWGRLTSYKQMSTYTRHLQELGLALPSGAADGDDSYIDFVPRAIIRHVPPPLADRLPTVDQLPPTAEAKGTHFASPQPLVQAATQLTLLLEQTPASLRPPLPRPLLERRLEQLRNWAYDPHELKQLAQEQGGHWRSDLALTVPPPQRALIDEAIERLTPIAGSEVKLEFLYALLRSAGILQPGHPVTVWPEVKNAFLKRDLSTQRAILARTYFDTTEWSVLWEMLREDDHLQLKRIFGHRFLRPEQLQDDLVRFRHLVLRVLSALPDDEWVMLSDLLPLMRLIWPQFDYSVWQRYLFYSPSWFLTSDRSEGPLRPMDERDWHQAQGQFLRWIITGPLHWLGLADLHLEAGRLAAVRFRGLADLYWNRVLAPPVPVSVGTGVEGAPADVTIDGDTIVVLPSATDGRVHGLLDRIARLETISPERFVYRFDPRAVYEAYEAGMALSEILEGWEQLISVPIPPETEERLTDWWKAYGQVRIYKDVTVIEFSDDYALDEMKAVTSLESVLIAELSPRLVMIPQDAVETLAAELETAGYTPKQTEEV